MFMCNFEKYHKLQGGCWLAKRGELNYKAEKQKTRRPKDQTPKDQKTRKPEDQNTRR